MPRELGRDPERAGNASSVCTVAELVDAEVLAALDAGLRWLVGHRWAACADPEGAR